MMFLPRVLLILRFQILQIVAIVVILDLHRRTNTIDLVVAVRIANHF
jgi:hypothetical protein